VKRGFQKTAGALFVAVMISPAQATVIGTADSSNSIPFGSPGGGFFYQQVYNSTNFSSPININEITFYNSVTPGGARMTGTFDIYLSTTTAQIPTFDTSAVTFPDSSFVNVFHGNLPALSNSRLDFNQLLSSFLYDPSQGNLLLTVRSFDAAAVGTDSSKWLFLDADGNVGLTNGRFSAFPFDWNQGLVTGFNDPAPTPLPAALPLFAGGAGVLGFLSWRRKRKAEVV
jgi:hypothetical protein